MTHREKVKAALDKILEAIGNSDEECPVHAFDKAKSDILDAIDDIESKVVDCYDLLHRVDISSLDDITTCRNNLYLLKKELY